MKNFFLDLVKEHKQWVKFDITYLSLYLICMCLLSYITSTTPNVMFNDYIGLQYSTNTGFSGGFLSDIITTNMNLIIRSIGFFIIIIIVYKYYEQMPITLAMYSAGAVSNLIEVIINGHVTDYIKILYWKTEMYNHYTIVNVADLLITTATLMMVYNIVSKALTDYYEKKFDEKGYTEIEA